MIDALPIYFFALLPHFNAMQQTAQQNRITANDSPASPNPPNTAGVYGNVLLRKLVGSY